MDGPRDYHTERTMSERERQRQILYIVYMWNLEKSYTDELICKAEIESKM